jgi:hypothetical protein
MELLNNYKFFKNTVLFVLLLSLPIPMFTQTINLGVLSSFEAYTGAGAITNTGTVTGDVGSDNGIVTGFDPLSYTGTVYNNNTVTAQCRIDLLRLYIHLNDIFVTFPGTHAAAFGAGETITSGVYSIPSAGSLGTTITLDGEGDSDAFFIIKYQGAMTVGVNAEVILINGTQSCNVFWIAEGAISVAAGAIIKGTLFAKLGAVGLGTGCDLEGRMLSMEGAITNGLGSVITPPPCVSTIQVNCSDSCIPAAAVDVLGSIGNFALFTSLGAVGNTGTSGIDGDIGTNGGSVGGYTSSIHFGSEYTADAITVQASIDLDNAYTQLLAMPGTVSHPAVFGSGETIYSGVYDIIGAGSLGGTITLDGGGDPDAIFVLKFGGAFTVAAQSKVILANGTRRCNVFWVGGAGVATGAVTIGAFGIMKGTILSHGGACNSGAGAFIEGRQLSTAGAVNTNAGIIYNDPVCVTSLSLPIELLSFTATVKDPHIQLNWTTATEINNDYFIVERSVIGIDFTPISKVNGAGNSTQSLSYSAVDESPFYGISYYRLKQTDYNGKTSYSNIVAVKFKNMNNSILDIYPNPFSTETAIHTSETLKDARLIVYNLNGQMVKQIKNISGQTFTFQRKDLSNGLYWIKLVQEGTVKAIDRLVITH